MAGVKGRSGRRILGIEDKRRAIIDKAWETIELALNNESLSLQYRADLAIKVAVKDMPTQLEGDIGGGDTKIIIVRPSENGREQTDKPIAVSRPLPIQQ